MTKQQAFLYMSIAVTVALLTLTGVLLALGMDVPDYLIAAFGAAVGFWFKSPDPADP